MKKYAYLIAVSVVLILCTTFFAYLAVAADSVLFTILTTLSVSVLTLYGLFVVYLNGSKEEVAIIEKIEKFFTEFGDLSKD